jgi:gentisate 1,2-dioxygenase
MALPGPHRIVRYTSKEQGKEGQDVSVRLGAQCEHLQAGARSSSARENASAVYHVIDGEGETSIGEVTIEWTKGDTFAIPAWQPYSLQVSQVQKDSIAE